MRLSVVLGEWLDRPIDADLAVAVEADRSATRSCGSARWPSSTPRRWRRPSSPAPSGSSRASDRSRSRCARPAQIALAVATVAATGRRTHVALGTSSDVVARWHGRDRHRGAADLLRTAATEVRALLDGERVDGFRLRQPPPAPTLTVAAFGPRRGRDRRAPPTGWCSTWSPSTPPPSSPAAAIPTPPSGWPPPSIRRRRSGGGCRSATSATSPRRATPRCSPPPASATLVAFARTRPHPRDLAARLPPSCSTPSPSSARDRGAARGSTSTPPPASPRSGSWSRRSTRRPDGGRSSCSRR